MSPLPFTVVTLVDADGYEFPIRLPGVYPDARESDVESARAIAGEQVKNRQIRPNGELRFDRIEYVGERTA
jgi:hypothetical protein